MSCCPLSILYRQVDGVKDVQMWGKLYYVDDRAATMDHNWHVHQTLVSNSLPPRNGLGQMLVTRLLSLCKLLLHINLQ